ncbi:MAG: nuclear transport factor 2 family protein [Dehalococcoidia bacterium]|nr:nuclear transport factor 2 family protein [Dehalococcoidia bacterium]
MLTLEDRAAIHDLYARYYHRVDYRPHEWPDCFTRDGTLAFSDGSVDLGGRDAIRAWTDAREGRRNAGDQPRGQHWCTNVLVEETPDGVRGSCYVMSITVNHQIAVMAHYEDAIAFEDGEWRFASRLIHIDSAAPPAYR